MREEEKTLAGRRQTLLSLPNYRVSDFHGEWRWPQGHASQVRGDGEMSAVPGDTGAPDKHLPLFWVLQTYPARDLTSPKLPTLSAQFSMANGLSCLHPGVKKALTDRGQELSRKIKIHVISCFRSCMKRFRSSACDL